MYLKLKISPQKKNTRFGERLPDGTWPVFIQEPATEGKANKALVDFLSEVLGIPKHRIGIVRGLQSRNKTVQISGMEEEEWTQRISSSLPLANKKPKKKKNQERE